ncbi:DUF4136 domain-containing protein [Pollutibacter soli]|uniref:DUF4136 domain-containing protein n=1 Tax=Pollutibacter soli TaxID=3034157 RepID=UPI003013F6AD
MKSAIRIFPVIVIILYALSCSPSLKVYSDYDRSQTFTKFKTYALFASDSSKPALSELNKKRILSAIQSEMVKKGFIENTTKPDLLVNAVAVRKNEVGVSFATDYYGYGGVYRPYAWSGTLGLSSGTTYQYDTYQDGSLIIDIVDASTKKVVWVGTGTARIDRPLKNPDQQIPEFIAKIMAGFPPGAPGTPLP